MELKDFFPIFRMVLIEEIEPETKTGGGIFIPSSALKQEDNTYRVIKVGKDCIEVQPGEGVLLTPGIRLTPRVIEGKVYFLVFENQIEAKFNFQVTSMSEFEVESVNISDKKSAKTSMNRQLSALGAIPNTKLNRQALEILENDNVRVTLTSKPKTTGGSFS